MAKVLLETIQVARHVGRLGLRPVQKAAEQVAQGAEDCGVWALKLQPVQQVLGRERVCAVLDSYFQAKQVVSESVVSLTHQSWMSGLQTGAQYATLFFSHTGIKARVVGPFDEHWNTLRVIKDLRAYEKERATRSGHSALQLTPKRFVQVMRDVERKKRASRQLDPVEAYVESMLQTGSLNSVGPRMLEKKLYTDVARVICFAFDRAVFEANGMDVWGHVLNVGMDMGQSNEDASARPRLRSTIGVEQVEALVDQMVKYEGLEAPIFMAGMQRHLLVNCCVMLLHLIEDLTSDRHMQVCLLGHALRITIEPLPLEQLWEEGEVAADASHRFHVNHAAVDELVQALIEEPEVQLAFVPDLVEAEVYRLALHRMICISQFMLSQLRICLFGNQVKLDFSAKDTGAGASNQSQGFGTAEAVEVTRVHLHRKDLRKHINRLEDERHRIELELQRRRRKEGSAPRRGSSLDMPALYEEEDGEGVHEFQRMAAQDRLSRSLAVQCVVDVPIEVAYKLVSDVAEYPKWMPFCTSARVLSTGGSRSGIQCEVGFGLATGTVLGTLGDTMRYRVMLSAPAIPRGGEEGDSRVARVVADTPGGFAYGRRLVYDWRFKEVRRGETDVRLDMFFQARSVFYLPLWDSLQATATGTLMEKFIERAEAISALGASSAAMSAAVAAAEESGKRPPAATAGR